VKKINSEVGKNEDTNPLHNKSNQAKDPVLRIQLRIRGASPRREPEEVTTYPKINEWSEGDKDDINKVVTPARKIVGSETLTRLH
jgi:hypothetical protein